MTLEEYEKTLADKRSKLNKKPVNEVKVDTKAFEGMKVYKPKEGEDNDLELSEKKQLGKNKAGLNEKARKEVSSCTVAFLLCPTNGVEQVWTCIYTALPLCGLSMSDPHTRLLHSTIRRYKFLLEHRGTTLRNSTEKGDKAL